MTDRSGPSPIEDDDRTRAAGRTAALQPPVEPPRPKPAPRETPTPGGPYARVGGLIAAGAFALGLVGSVAFGLGESWIGDPVGGEVDWSLRATPWNPVVWRRAGLDRSYADGDPAAAVAPLASAARLSPLESAPRIELASHLEASGDTSAAEKALLEAAERDAGFEPRWELANFYLRNGDEDAFWRWIRDAVTVYPDGVATALGLCWRAYGDPALIQERATPDDLEVTRRYFDYLTETGRIEALRLLWPRFGPVMQESDLPAVSTYIALLLRQGPLDEPLEIWNDLCRRGLLPYDPISPDQGPYLTNARFNSPISTLGFDWRLDRANAVQRIQRQVEGPIMGVEFRLSGNQDEEVTLMHQILPLVGGRDFTLNFQYATQRLPRDTGLGWVVRDHNSGALLAAGDPLIAAEDFWDQSRFTFHAPEGLHALRLEFRYKLTAGNTRQRGRLVLRGLEMRPATADEIPATAPASTVPAAEDARTEN